jgi:pimeloyl-ACP methyl ester carboxylesterase
MPSRTLSGRGQRQARMFVLDNCGHAPNIEQPEEFNRLAEEFLAEIGYV